MSRARIECGVPYPNTYSDIDCRVCGNWFTTTGELTAHEEHFHQNVKA